MPAVKFDVEDVGAKGEAIYREKIRPRLTEADKGKYLIINTVTGEYLLGKDYEEVANRARAQFPQGQPRYGMRIGYRSLFSFRPGLNRELEEW